MRKIVRHKRIGINKNKTMASVSRVISDHSSADNSRYVKYMCNDCKFYEGQCTKHRIVRICAQKGLKNK